MPSNRISLSQARKILGSGEQLQWEEHANHKAGKVKLEGTRSKRLFKHLSGLTTDELENLGDQVFQELIDIWLSDDEDNQDHDDIHVTSTNTESWTLKKLQSYGFGGLNHYGANLFTLDIDGETWCIEGQNGSGKSSLANAIIWAFTGKIVSEHSGRLEDVSERKDVYNENGVKIGTWPPIASYPDDPTNLNEPAKVFVKLIFESDSGTISTVYRRMRSFSDGTPADNLRLLPTDISASIHLVDVGLIMPSRVGSLGFGDKSESLSAAVKTLMGLDALEHIGKSVAKLKRGGSRFLNYAKQQRIVDIENDYLKWLDVAKRNSETTGYDFDCFSELNEKWEIDELETICSEAESKAVSKMQTLVDFISEAIDLSDTKGRGKVKNSVEKVKVFITSSPNGLNSFKALAALSNSRGDGNLANLAGKLDDAEQSLLLALDWHQKQQEDTKLRFKAEASLWIGNLPVTHCPLCEDELLSEKQKALASELEEIQGSAIQAKIELNDACNKILTDISSCIPPSINAALQTLTNGSVKKSLLDDINQSLVNSNEMVTLIGAKLLLDEALKKRWGDLPIPPSPNTKNAERTLPSPARRVWDEIQKYRHILSLSDWWAQERQSYWNFWKQVIGQPLTNEDGAEFPQSILGKHLETLNGSLLDAKPYEDTVNALNNATKKAIRWREINSHQLMREDIAKSVSPLSELVNFVNAETSRSIDALSNRIEDVLGRIHLCDKLDYQNTSFTRQSASKSSVEISASLSANFKIDATLVANTSWLRAILWAFIFSLREETVESIGYNPFPLMVLDDPQTTFDPRNEQMWAAEIVRLTNETGLHKVQAIVTTHETAFFKTLVEVNKDFHGRHGRIASVTEEVGTVLIENDTHIDRLWNSANAKNDDQLAREFIEKLRVFLECTVRYILWGEGASVRGELLSGLIQRLQRLVDSEDRPFHHRQVVRLANRLTGNATIIGKIQDIHHRINQGLPDARDIHEKFWKHVKGDLHDSFNIVAEFRVYQGDSRQYSYNSNIVPLNSHQKEEVRSLNLVNTGIAAAARTDGRAGDGIITIEELANCPEVKLYNHDVYRLVSPTLEPVANIGDFLIVINHSSIENRSLVVAGHESRFLARRYSEPEEHPLTAVLTAQCTDPNSIADPVLIPTKAINAKSIVGTLFNANTSVIESATDGSEVAIVSDVTSYKALIDNARLFKVEGQSAEPIALDGQYLLTGQDVTSQQDIIRMDGRLVIASDSEGTRYFKRLRAIAKETIILESLNADGYYPSIVASLDSSQDIQITTVLPVTGVLFELP